MHEYSLARSLVRQVEDLRLEQDAAHVVCVQLRVGEFSGIEPELLRSAFDDLVSCTPLEGARLQMKRVPILARCESCGIEFAIPSTGPSRFRFRCPDCRGHDLSIEQGENLLLESVTMEAQAT
jgi:hydrogenase nickel incorporation protein HypA/HybF